MSIETTNLQLIKPTENDFYDINLINANMDKIDAAVAAKETPAGVQAKVDAHINSADPHVEYIKKSLATAVNDFIVASAPGVFVKKTLAEIKTILGLGSAAYTASTAYATAAQGTKADNAATQASVDAQLADYVRQPGYGTTAGSTTAYTLTPDPAITAYAAGQCFAVKIHVANTGAATLNVNAKGAKSILDSKGNTMTAGKLRLNGVYTLRYDGTNFILQGEGGSGNATAPDLLSGRTASVDTGDIVGTMVNNGAVNIQSTYTSDTTIAEGYHNGSGKVLAPLVVAGDAQMGNALITTEFILTTDPDDEGDIQAGTSGSRSFKIKYKGTYRVKFDLRNFSDNSAHAQIRVNGIAVGTIRVATSTTFVTYSQDFNLKVDDVITLWGRGDSNSAGRVRNFAVCAGVNHYTPDVL